MTLYSAGDRIGAAFHIGTPVILVRWRGRRSGREMAKPLSDGIPMADIPEISLIIKDMPRVIPEVANVSKESQKKSTIHNLYRNDDTTVRAASNSKDGLPIIAVEHQAISGPSEIRPLHIESNTTVHEPKTVETRSVLNNQIEEIPFQSITVPREKDLRIKKKPIKKKYKNRTPNLKERADLILKQHALSFK